MSLLKLEGVHTHIGAYHILHGVDFEVPSGEVTMLLGRNGAGKTTTLRTIMGLWPASKGRVSFDGQVIGGEGAPKGRGTPDIAQMGIAYVPESMGIFGDLSVRENMVLAARAARHADQIDTQRLEWLFGLFPALKKNVLGVPLCLTFGVLMFAAMVWLKLPLIWSLLGLGVVSCLLAWRKLVP